MNLSEAWQIVLGAVGGLGSIVVYLLVLMLGLCLLLDRTKFRPTRNSRTVKSLDELVGAPIRYLPPDAPRGTTDQLSAATRKA